MGTIFQEQGILEKAAACFLKTTELNPSFADAYCNLAIVLREKDKVDEAILHFRKAIEINPALADAHYNLATVLMVYPWKEKHSLYMQNRESGRNSCLPPVCLK